MRYPAAGKTTAAQAARRRTDAVHRVRLAQALHADSVEAIQAPGVICEQRIAHTRGAIRQFLAQCEAGSPVAVETIGKGYWIIDEIEQALMRPQLTHERKAKLMLGSVIKAGRAGLEPPAAQRHAAYGVDSAGAVA